MIDYIHCDDGGCDGGCRQTKPMRLVLDPRYLEESALGHRDYVTQHTAAAIARASRWLVMHGERRDYHFCPLHRSHVAIVLRFAAAEVAGAPRGIHAALRALGVSDLGDLARAVWVVFHGANIEPTRPHRETLLEAARRAEEGAQ